ncbi:uncharacterized protein LOC112533551 isoform X3 [Gallus gallus]|uniref:uncharacterized protein LOC112533551 isoform X3 n=1 Tax=Gallus gallus TaxID=9031 RepID=UPI001AE35881|nr:uncharacterized protein LOC112533551 isoform X3 [Gallus gallus]
MRTWSHWDPVFGTVWGHPSIGIHRFPLIWGHPLIGIHRFPYPGPYGVIRPLGAISSQIQVHMGSSVHWEPSVPISGSIWGHPYIGIHQFPLPWLYEDMEPLGSRFLGPFGVIRPLGAISSQIQVHMGSSVHWEPSVPISGSIWGHPYIGIHQFPLPWLYEDMEPLGSCFLGPFGVIRPLGPSVPVYMGSSIHWDPSVPVDMGSSIHWDPSVPKSRAIWGHPSNGIHRFPLPWLYEDMDPLGSRFWDRLGSSVHWEPSVPISVSIWGHLSIGIHQFPFLGPYGVIRPLGSIGSHFQVHMGSSVHWDPSVPISRSIWGHPSIGIHQFLFIWGHPSIGIHRFPFWGPFGVIHPLGSIRSYFQSHSSPIGIPLGPLQSHRGSSNPIGIAPTLSGPFRSH